MLWLACSPESLAYQYLVCLVIAYRFSKPNAAVSETLFFLFLGRIPFKTNPKAPQRDTPHLQKTFIRHPAA